MTDDAGIRSHISELIAAEKTLRERLGRGEITEEQEHNQLRQVEIELDQAWDLLRQRQARREYGQDPDEAQTRPATTVESYLD